LKILIADDDRMSRRLLQKTLEREGYQVIAVDNGQLALEQLVLPDGPRLALLDWMMPELDGPGVCREIRTQHERPYVHIVLLTSRGSKQDIVAGLEAGADDYLTKPYDSAELAARLRTGQRILQLEDRLVEARETMRFKATHDHLTSLFNRGVIIDLLARELTRTRRENGSTVVMLGDLDHFKCYMQHPVFAAPTLRRRHGFTDQFSSYFLFNFRAVFLCNPVEKYRHGKLEVGRLHDFAHLVSNAH